MSDDVDVEATKLRNSFALALRPALALHSKTLKGNAQKSDDKDEPAATTKQPLDDDIFVANFVFFCEGR